MARTFNGTSDFAAVTDHDALEPPLISIAMRFKPASGAGSAFPVMITKEPSPATAGYILHIINTDELKWKVNGDDTNQITTTSLNLALDREHTVVAGWDGATLYLCVDGQVAGTIAKSGTIATSTQQVDIGTYRGGSADTWYKGVIDEWALYRGWVGLPAAVKFHRGAPLNEVRPDLLSVRYPMDCLGTREIGRGVPTVTTLTGTVPSARLRRRSRLREWYDVSAPAAAATFIGARYQMPGVQTFGGRQAA